MFRPLALLLLLAPGTLPAQPLSVDLAKRHFQSGSAYFEEGRFDEAIREFRETYRLSPRVELLFNIAKAFDRKGDAARAIEAYQVYLQAQPQAADRAKIEQTIAQLKEHIGQVRLVDVPAGAEVWIDGYSVGREPFAAPVTVTAGQREIEARPSDGSATRRISVLVPARGMVTATLPQPKREVVVKEVVVERLVEAPRWYRSKAGWGLTVAGAALAITGAALLGSAPSFQSDSHAAGKRETEYLALQDQAQLFQQLGAGLLGGGAAVTIAGIVLFIAQGRSDRPAHAWIAPSGGGLVIGGSFE